MKSCAAFVIIMFCLAGPSIGSTAIDFNDGTTGVDIDGFYAGLGVTFSNAEWNDVIAGYTPTDPTGLRILADGANTRPKVDSPIILTFSGLVSDVSIFADSVNLNGARMDAYDAAVGGSLVDFMQVFGTSGNTSSSANFLLSVSAPTIYRVELYQPSSVESEGVLFDNLTFVNAIPEPASAALLGFAALALLARRRREA